MELVSRELFAESPEKGVAGLGYCWYVRAEGVEMEAMYATQTRSDTNDRRWRRWSSDNGRTWGEAEEIEFIRRTPEGTHRTYTRAGHVDPFTGRLIRFANRACLPTDNPSEGASQWSIWYEVSLDGGRSYAEARQVMGEGFTPEHPFEPIFMGRNAYSIGDKTCVPLFLTDGTILQPFQIRELDGNGEPFQPYGVPFCQSRVAIGRWQDETTIRWELSEAARLSPERTTRGVLEPTLARMPHGRMLMVLRGSNMKRTELPGYRWYSVSHDDGRTWGEVRPWTFASGESFFSPSSCSLLLHHSNGRLYWLGNISRENPDGNLPRYPFVIGEVDQGSLLLRKETIMVVDDLQPGEQLRLCLSNFCAYEDRETREIVFCMPRWFAHRERASDWTAHSYRYRVRV